MSRSVGRKTSTSPAPSRHSFLDGVGHAAQRVDLFAVVFAHERPVADFDGIRAAGDFDDRRRDRPRSLT